MRKDRSALVTRRRLLTTGAVAAAALSVPMIVPASALGRGGAIAPSERIVMGAIGIGGRGTHDLNWFLAEKDVHYAAVCDVNRVRREAAKQRINRENGTSDCRTYVDIRDFLAQCTDLDAVQIATGDRWHALASIMAMRAGLDVYCEKPSCLTIAQGQAVVETARRYGRVYQTGAQRLSEANHVFGIEMARSGRLGKIHTIYADIRYRGGYRQEWLPAETTPAKEELDWDAWLGPCAWRPYNRQYVNHGWYNFEGMATDVAMWGAHTVAQALAGIDMSEVSWIELEYSDAENSMMTRLSNGVKMVLWRKPGDVWQPCEYWHGACGERFEGSEGWASAADSYSRPDVSSPALLTDFRKIVGDYTERTGRPMNHVRDFLNCVKNRRPTVAGPQVMFQSMAICLAADMCETLKRNLKFDLNKAQFIGDDQANRMRSRAMREPWVI